MRILVRAGHREDPDRPKFLYHYTNGDGLLGIVNSKKLWATKIQYLNDRSELNHAISLGRTIIYRLERETDSEPVRQFLGKIREDFERVERVNIFVFSFSYARDLLSQWRAYCCDGGYALGFDPRVIKKLGKGQGFRFVKCIYAEKEQESVVRRILENRLSSFQEALKTERDTERILNLIKDSSWQAVVDLTSVSPQFKHPSFIEEEEYRLISELKRADDRAINCRNKGNLLIPYCEFSLENPGIEFEIEEIIIGPGLPIELAMDSVSTLFHRNKGNYGSISHTSIPYRKWG